MAAGIYERRILPRLIHLAMRQERLAPFRHRIVSAASGRVLEIGAGSGLNLPLYGAAVSRVIALDRSATLLEMARRGSICFASRPIQLLEASADALPIESHSIDTVVTTWTLCSIANVAAALQEVRRVLRPGGRLLFAEHGRAPDPRVARWQDRLTPLWRRIAGGCHLNRRIPTLVEEAGFSITRLETGYLDGPRILTYMFEGEARRH